MVRASRYSREEGVAFVAAAFDEPSADLLAELGVDAFKFASGDLLNVPFLRYVAALGKPMFLSTGGGTLEDIDRAVEAIAERNRQLCILHCTASYPADVEDLNLSVITALTERYPELRDRALRPPQRDRDGARRLHARGARVREALHAEPRAGRARITRTR